MKCVTNLEVSQYIQTVSKDYFNSYNIADTIWISKNGRIELDTFVVEWVWADKRRFVEITLGEPN